LTEFIGGTHAPSAVAAATLTHDVAIGSGKYVLEHASMNVEQVSPAYGGISWRWKAEDASYDSSALVLGYSTLREALLLQRPFRITGPGSIRFRMFLTEAGTFTWRYALREVYE